MAERPSPPTVTLTGGTASAERPDQLDSGLDETVDSTHRLRRRRIRTALACLLLLLAVGTGAEVAERRAAGDAAMAQEMRDRSAVDLALSNDWTGSSSYEPATDSLLYEVQMTVSNNGPRAVTVLSVGLPGAAELDSPVSLAAGAERRLTLDGVYSCADSFPQGPPDRVPFEVRTETGLALVDVSIPAGLFDNDPLVQACEQTRASQ
jgi:hypothetical protein